MLRDEVDVQLYAKAAEPFPEEDHLSDVRGGVSITYVTGERVLTRLNETWGVHGWAFQIIEKWKDEDADECVVHGRLTVYKRQELQDFTDDGETTAENMTRVRETIHSVIHEQFGSQKIKRSRGSGRPLDIGFDWKGAATDALKKCASLAGIALYLWNKSETAQLKAMWAEDKEREQKAAGRQEQPTRTTGAPAATSQEQPTEQRGEARRPRPFNAGRRNEQQESPKDVQLVINGVVMPVGFKMPFQLGKETDKAPQQCREMDCPDDVLPDVNYKVGGENKPGSYVIRRSREEAGTILCVKHTAAWCKAKQAVAQSTAA